LQFLIISKPTNYHAISTNRPPTDKNPKRINQGQAAVMVNKI